MFLMKLRENLSLYNELRQNKGMMSHGFQSNFWPELQKAHLKTGSPSIISCENILEVLVCYSIGVLFEDNVL